MGSSMAAKIEYQTSSGTHSPWLIGILALLIPGGGASVVEAL